MPAWKGCQQLLVCLLDKNFIFSSSADNLQAQLSRFSLTTELPWLSAAARSMWAHTDRRGLHAGVQQPALQRYQVTAPPTPLTNNAVLPFETGLPVPDPLLPSLARFHAGKGRQRLLRRTWRRQKHFCSRSTYPAILAELNPSVFAHLLPLPLNTCLAGHDLLEGGLRWKKWGQLGYISRQPQSSSTTAKSSEGVPDVQSLSPTARMSGNKERALWTPIPKHGPGDLEDNFCLYRFIRTLSRIPSLMKRSARVRIQAPVTRHLEGQTDQTLGQYLSLRGAGTAPASVCSLAKTSK